MNSNSDTSQKYDTVTLGNGCFWCTEAVFQRLDGVIEVKSGYSGGDVAHPDYYSVSSGVTGHAECLEIKYDPSMLTFEDILEVFFETHDPTTLNRQGNDIGTQYRSVIFYHNDDQKEIANKFIKNLESSGKYKNPIVTTIETYSKFYPAEKEHQNYYNLNGTASYCQFVVKPKVDKFKKLFGERMKTS